MKIKEGEKLPSISLYLITEKGAEKISLQKLIENKKVIIFGLPGAFTSVCSAKHLPSFVNSYSEIKEAGIEKIICVSVNDPFVMKAWGEQHGVNNRIIMAGDPYLEFTKAIGAEVDKSKKGLGIRSSRYSMFIENNLVKKIEEEKETSSCETTAAENFIKKI
tara:strand:- start:548 stop:1033 length:486 start_codon:yes stop_codon:yes gene_type:complete